MTPIFPDLLQMLPPALFRARSAGQSLMAADPQGFSLDSGTGIQAGQDFGAQGFWTAALSPDEQAEPPVPPRGSVESDCDTWRGA